VSRVAWISLSVSALALVAGIGVVALLAQGSSGNETAPLVTESTSSSPIRSFSLPLTSSPSVLALGKHDGNVLVGIAAKPGGPVEVAVLRAEAPLATDKLRFELDDAKTEARSCGTGCSRIDAAVLDGAPSRLRVRVGSSSVAFGLPARLPRSGEALLARALRTMDGLRAYRYLETLTSGQGGVVTRYEVQAPNRLSLRTPGYRSVIIGKDRWDYLGTRWQRESFPGLNVAELLVWSRAMHARVVGRRPNGVTELAAFGLLPVPAWFRLAVAPTGRVVEAQMIAPSHFMVHRYSDFNGRITIFPPAHPIEAPK
jgi:hypothetical protein